MRLLHVYVVLFLFVTVASAEIIDVGPFGANAYDVGGEEGSGIYAQAFVAPEENIFVLGGMYLYGGRLDPLEIRCLRPVEWLGALGLKAGARIPFSVEEIGAVGVADVIAVEPCPPIEDGPGRVVLATFTHLNAHVLQIRLDGAEEPLEPTEGHQFYCEERGAWVPAAELRTGEHVRSRSGSARVVRIERKPGVYRVYNLEVETEHWYYVGRLETLSHNATGCWWFGPNEQAWLELLKEATRGKKRVSEADWKILKEFLEGPDPEFVRRVRPDPPGHWFGGAHIHRPGTSKHYPLGPEPYIIGIPPLPGGPGYGFPDFGEPYTPPAPEDESACGGLGIDVIE